MDFLSSAVVTNVQQQQVTARAEEELGRLRAQIAWLQTERAALWWAVGHDELTGLPNRRLFYTLAPPLLRQAGRSAVVLVMDLNGFKPINDTFGHDTGDTVLRLVGQRMASCAGDDLVARLGGDEFAAVLTNRHGQPHKDWWRIAVARLSTAVAQPMAVTGRVLAVTASIGVAPADDDSLIGDLMRFADLAMYRAKATGRSHLVWTGDEVSGEAAGEPPHQPPLPAQTGPDHGETAELTVWAAAAPATGYQPGDRVWVYRNGAWRPGVVEGVASTAVMATYRCADGRGTAVDTMSAQYVLPRADVDTQLDRATASRMAA